MRAGDAAEHTALHRHLQNFDLSFLRTFAAFLFCLQLILAVFHTAFLLDYIVISADLPALAPSLLASVASNTPLSLIPFPIILNVCMHVFTIIDESNNKLE